MKRPKLLQQLKTLNVIESSLNIGKTGEAIITEWERITAGLNTYQRETALLQNGFRALPRYFAIAGSQPIPSEIPVRLFQEPRKEEGVILRLAQLDAASEIVKEWSKEALEGVYSFAVASDFIRPDEQFPFPVALIQTGIVRNERFRLPQQSFWADQEVKLIPVNDLFEVSQPSQLEVFFQWYIFELEINLLIQQIRNTWNEGIKPICMTTLPFSLSAVEATSLTNVLPAERYHRYEKLLKELFTLSEEARIPVISFCKTPATNDIGQLILAISGGRTNNRISDSKFLHPIMEAGERTAVFLTNSFGDSDTLNRPVAFAYLKSSSQQPPHRVEFPYWLLESDIYQHVLTTIVAEATDTNDGTPLTLGSAQYRARLSYSDTDFFNYLLHHVIKEQSKLAEGRPIPPVPLSLFWEE